MTDKVDQANTTSELLRSNAIASHFAAAQLNHDKTPLPNGECRWCSAVAANDTVFCCEECAKDWQEQNARQIKARLIAGK